MILVIDHRDSFTHNLEHQLARCAPVRVVQQHLWTQEDLLSASMLVLSPGPGNPGDYPRTCELYRSFKGRLPMLGVCLGFQVMAYCEGASIVRQAHVTHGVQAAALVSQQSIAFKGMNNPLAVARYHSLQVQRDSFPTNYMLTATDAEGQVPLAFECPDNKLFGLQFHPDSFLTPDGFQIIQNIAHACLDK